MPSDTAFARLLGHAVEHHRAGRLGTAEKAYRQALRRRPGDGEALRLLGILRCQQGDAAGGAALLRQAAAAAPDNAAAHGDLGVALEAAGDRAGAAASYRRALALDPVAAGTHYNLGNVLLAEGDAAGAAASYRRALALRPGDAEAWNNLGTALMRAAQPAEASAAFRRAVGLAPDRASVWRNLGAVLAQRLEPLEAGRCFERAVALEPDDVATLTRCGEIARSVGRFAEAERHLRRALTLAPDAAAPLSALGELLYGQGRIGELEALGRAALARDPELALGHFQLAYATAAQGRHDAAEASFRRALQLEPALPLVELPDYCGPLFDLHYRADRTPAEIAAAHRLWGERAVRAAAGTEAASTAAAEPPAPAIVEAEPPARPLRAGYASPDLCHHAVSFFLEPLLAHHDPAVVESFCYAEVAVPDAVTRRLQGLVRHWRSSVGVEDAALRRMIRDDRIDMLIDLAGHSARSRLAAFAIKPAPVTLTWLGYPGTTGLSTIDYRVTDAIADPPGLTEAWHSERLLRLPEGFLCYRPPDYAPDVTPRAAGRPGQVTFASFNNLDKVTPAVLALWAAILRALPEARLLLKSRNLADPETSRLCRERLVAGGAAPEQIELRGFAAAPPDHLATYGEVDIALDPFPYNGTTTTCEALWMGVPVITLAGGRHAGRVGLDLLTRLDLAHFAVATEAAYVAAAVALARDGAARTSLRASLRRRLAASVLCDGARFARAFEAALLEAWHECRTGMREAAAP